MIRSCGCLVALAVILGLLGLALFYHSTLFAAAGHALLQSDPLQKSDVIVVMAGAYGVRAGEAALLYREQWSPKVLLTREQPPDGYDDLTQLGVRLPEMIDLNQSVLEKLGVPADAVWRVEDRVDSTDQEARSIRAFLQAKGAKRVIVVTSKTHSRRACMVFRHYLGPEYPVVCRYSRFDKFDPSAWWKKRRDIRELFFEWQKMILYRVQYALGR